jgi:glycine/D-amino acid oxidase-like deaminating enzyme
MAKKIITTDVVIIGAGIAGLWLHHRLNKMGFHALLLEHKTMGNAQTLSSQGIIHGGAKYALNGILSKATQAIGDMPARWQACLAGQGEVDLTKVKVLADHQLLWSKQQLSSKMMSFFASKALSSRMQTVAKAKQPAIFQNPDFKGALYRLEEPVLDIPSVVKSLAEPWQDRILKIPGNSEFSWHKQANKVQSIRLNNDIEIQAQQFVLTAGEGNQALLDSLAIAKPLMQRRPLQMVLCKAKNKHYSLPAIYAHSLGSGSKPVATITSHLDSANNIVWYIGGNIAEQGVNKDFDSITTEAEALLRDILPWFKLPELDWSSHAINRAEPKQSALSRPDTAFVESNNNIHIAWPTKLALAPALSDSVISALTKQGLTAKYHAINSYLPLADIGPSLWDSTFK